MLHRRCDTARMAFGWRACHDDIALGLQACRANNLDCLRHNRDAGKIIRHTPAMDAPISDVAREGIMLPGFGIPERFTIRMAEENQARPTARTGKPRDDAGAFLTGHRLAFGEFMAHLYIGRHIGKRFHLAASIA